MILFPGKRVQAVFPLLSAFFLPIASPVSVRIECGIEGIEVFAVQMILRDAERFTDTINMKWIRKEPSTLFFE